MNKISNGPTSKAMKPERWLYTKSIYSLYGYSNLGWSLRLQSFFLCAQFSDRLSARHARNSLLFGRDVLRKDLDAVLGLELADEARVPQLACDAEVFAAAHERVALARLGCGRDTRRVKVLLLPTGDGDESAKGGARRHVSARKLEIAPVSCMRTCQDTRGRILGRRPWGRRSSRCGARGPSLPARTPCSRHGGI